MFIARCGLSVRAVIAADDSVESLKQGTNRTRFFREAPFPPFASKGRREQPERGGWVQPTISHRVTSAGLHPPDARRTIEGVILPSPRFNQAEGDQESVICFAFFGRSHGEAERATATETSSNNDAIMTLTPSAAASARPSPPRAQSPGQANRLTRRRLSPFLLSFLPYKDPCSGCWPCLSTAPN